MAGRPQNGVPVIQQRAGFSFYLLMTFVISTCLMVICYLALLEGWYGEVLSVEAADVPVLWRNGLHVLVYDGGCAGPAAQERAAWRDFLERRRIHFDEVRGVPADVNRAPAVLVLPSFACLDDSAPERIRAWVAGGGSLVVSGALDPRDRDALTRHQDLWQELAGIRLTESVGPAPAFLTLSSTFPLGAGLAPGERWRLSAGVAGFASGAPVAYWSDARLQPRAAELSAVAGVVERSSGRSRMVWLGAPLIGVAPTEKNHAAWERLLLNSLFWTGRRPMATLAAWPEGKPAAVALAAEVRTPGELSDAVEMTRALGSRGVAGTFFLDPKLTGVPARIRELARGGEIGILAEAGEAGAALPGDLQQHRLRLQEESGRAIQGVRQLGRSTDEDAERRLAQMGFRYYSNEAPPTAAAPRIQHFSQSVLFPLDARAVVRLPATGTDDVAVLSGQGSVAAAEGVAGQLIRDFEMARRLQGVHVLNYRMDLLGSASPRPALLRALDHARERGAWVATMSEVAAWWKTRELIDVSVDRLTLRRLRLRVSNRGQDDVEHLIVRVALPFAPHTVRTLPTVFGAAKLAVRWEPGTDRLEVRIPRVKAQTGMTWVMDLD